MYCSMHRFKKSRFGRRLAVVYALSFCLTRPKHSNASSHHAKAMGGRGLYAWNALLYGALMLLMLVSTAWSNPYEEEVISLSERGEDVEAVTVYERELADQDEVSIEVMRAIAGSYWRLRRFDEARTLYREIMRRQPTMSGLVEEEVEILEEEEPLDPVDDPPEAAVVAEDEDDRVVEDPSAEEDAVTPSTRDIFQSELEALRAAYEELEEDRDRRREAVEERMIELMVRTEETIEQMEKLEVELQETRKERDAAIEDRDVSADEQAAQIADLEDALTEAREEQRAARQQISDLEGTLADLRTAKAEEEAAAASRTEALEDKVASLQERLEDQEASAVARQDELRERMEALRDREGALASELAEKEEEYARLERESQRRIAELEDQLDDVSHQLDSERIASRARRSDYLDTEERLQARLAEQQAEYRLLRARYETLRATAEEDARARETLLAEKQALEERLAQVDGVQGSEIQKKAARIAALEDKLARRDGEWVESLEHVQGSALNRALTEILRLEEEFRRMDGERTAEQQRLRERIDSLEVALSSHEDIQRELEGALAEEREQREALEERVREQQVELAETEALLEEATHALDQHYEAMRQQLGGESLFPVSDGVDEKQSLAPIHRAAVPYTESAALEADALMRALQADKQSLVEALEQVETERDAMATYIENLQAEKEQQEIGLRATYEEQIADMEASWSARERRLQDELQEKERALAGVRTLAERMQEDVVASRAAQEDILQAARDSAADLSRRVEALEQGGPSRAFVAGREDAVADMDEDGSIMHALRAGDLEEGVALYEALDAPETIDLQTKRSVANAYRNLGRYAEAYSMYERILERDPEHAFAEQKRIMVLFNMGEYTRALELLSESEDVDLPEREEK